MIRRASGAIMFDITRTARADALIPIFQITGTPTEGEPLTARFVINQEFVTATAARVELQWQRDGQPIKEGYKSRYQLSEADVDADISADISIKVGERVLAHRSLNFDASIEMAEKNRKPVMR